MCPERYLISQSHPNCFEFSGRLLSAKFESDSQWYLICWYFIWFTTILLQSPTVLFLLCSRISSLNDALLLVNSLHMCGFLAMVNFHLLYICPYPYRTWGNPLSLWHREKNWVSEEKKKKIHRKKLQKTSPYFLQKFYAYIKNQYVEHIK